MSRELVIEARTRAIFNKFWAEVGSDPLWLKNVLQNNPDIMQRLLNAFVSENPAADFSVVVSAVKAVAREEARVAATNQVDNPPFNLEWVQETFEYQ